ncbi:MIP/aquaporin family protein [Tepidibacillus infernus]|uniref:MIP/aquaporin family protein n=1 Tax=Tepidibacillus infernus TaxID=1806172 RepID=UPI003A39239E
MTSFMGEVIGTMILIIFGAGVNAGLSLKKSYANGGGWIVTTFGWGFAVAFAVYAVGSISGAHVNPAVTIGLAMVGDFPWADVPSYILAQMIGAIIGATFVWIFYLPHWKETEDQGTKLGVFSTGPAVPNVAANLVSEILGTFILLLAISFIGANKFTEGLNPIIVGFLIVAIGMSLGGTTGYAINPARDLGPRIAHFILPIAGKGNSNWSYAWIPVVGPIIGGSLGALFYKAVFAGKVYSSLWIFAAITIIIILAAIVQSGKSVNTSVNNKKVTA